MLPRLNKQTHKSINHQRPPVIFHSKPNIPSVINSFWDNMTAEKKKPKNLMKGKQLKKISRNGKFRHP